jgi:hypothetical protein
MAVAHNKNVKRSAQTQEDETILLVGMQGVRQNPRILVKECTACLLK